MPSHDSLPPINPSLLPSSLQGGWLPRSPGESRRRYGKPKLKNLIRVTAPLFVPVSVHSQVLQWAHVSRFACHLGDRRTISLLKRHFWWPRMYANTKEFAAACSTCPLQGFQSSPCRPAPSAPCSTLAMVAHCSGLCHWVTPISR